MLIVVIPVIVIWIGWWYFVVQWWFQSTAFLRSSCVGYFFNKMIVEHPDSSEKNKLSSCLDRRQPRTAVRS